MAGGDNVNDQVEGKSAKGAAGGDNLESVRTERGSSPVEQPLRPMSEGERAALEKLKPAEVSMGVDEAIKAIQEGKLDPSKKYTIKVDSSQKDSGGRNEAKELFEAFKEKGGSMMFDKGYHESPFYKQSGEGVISTSESRIALGKELTLKVGDKTITLPPGKVNADKTTEGTVFPNGTIIDQPSGKIRSVDPNAKGVMVGGHFIENGTVIPSEHISKNNGETGQSFKPGNWLKARPTVDEAGRPILDTHPIDEKTFGKKWDKVGENVYGTKKSPTEHFKLPSNVTVESITPYSDGKPVKLDPGTYYRADGYSVTPKDLLETWNGYAGDEKAYEHIKGEFAKNGKQDSSHARMMEDNRRAYQEEAKAKAAGVNPAELAAVKGVNLEEAGKVGAEKPGIDPKLAAQFEQRVPPELKAVLEGSPAKAKEVLDALDRNRATIKDEATRKFAESILAEAKVHEKGSVAERTAGKVSTGMSVIALAAIGAGILAYTHPEEAKALVEKGKRALQGSIN